jgi:hypothetical protein
MRHAHDFMRNMQSLVSLVPVLRSETQGALLFALMIGGHEGDTITQLADAIGSDRPLLSERSTGWKRPEF